MYFVVPEYRIPDALSHPSFPLLHAPPTNGCKIGFTLFIPAPLKSHTVCTYAVFCHVCTGPQNYPGWDEGWLAVVRQRIQIEDEVVEDIAELDLDGVAAESQVTRAITCRVCSVSLRAVSVFSSRLPFEPGLCLRVCFCFVLRRLGRARDTKNLGCGGGHTVGAVMRD